VFELVVGAVILTATVIGISWWRAQEHQWHAADELVERVDDEGTNGNDH
jgi:hypothetical protein